MKLKSISAQNLKGRSFQIDVADRPVLVLLGDSFAGKTAILDAVRIALLGYHPKLGKRGTTKLASAQEFSVALDFQGEGLARRWWQQKGSWKSEGPDESFVPPAMLDCREYFGMTATDRMNYVFGQLSLDALGFTDEKLVGVVRSLRVEGTDPDLTEAAVQEAIKVVAETVAARHVEDATLQECIAQVISEFGERKKAAAAAVKQFEGLTQGATQLRAASPAAPARSVEDEVDKAREAHGEKIHALRFLQAALEAEKKHKDRIALLENELKRAKNYQDDIREAETAVLRIEKEVEAALPDIEPARKRAADLKQQLTHAEADGRRLQAEREKLRVDNQEKLAMTCCPFCKSSRKGWQEALVAEHAGKVAENAALQEQVKAVLAKLQPAVEAAVKDYDARAEAARTRSEFMQALAEKNRELNTLRRLDEAFAASRTELAMLKGNMPGKADGFRVPELETEIQLAKVEVDRLAEAQRIYHAAKAEEAQMLKAGAAHKQHKTRALVFAAAQEVIQGLQQAMTDQAIGALMDVANKFTAGILRGRLEYRDGDIGYTRAAEPAAAGTVQPGEQWVSHECFSGTEEALAYAGLSVALAQQSRCKLVLIDELGIVDAQTKAKMMMRFVDLQAAGVIDGFLGADVSDAGLRVDGVALEKVA